MDGVVCGGTAIDLERGGKAREIESNSSGHTLSVSKTNDEEGKAVGSRPPKISRTRAPRLSRNQVYSETLPPSDVLAEPPVFKAQGRADPKDSDPRLGLN